MPLAPRHTRRWLIGFALFACATIALSFVVVSAYKSIDALPHGGERLIRHRLQTQVADVIAGRSHLIVVEGRDGELAAADELQRHIDSLDGVGPFTLRIVRMRRTDDLLKSVRELRGWRRLELGTNDVTDSAMAYVATLPDLEELVLYELNVSDKGLGKLSASPKLETLYLAPWHKGDVSIPTVISLPTVRRLSLEETFPDHWLEPSLDELANATSLKELTIVAITLYQDKIDTLKAKLPGCVIETRDWKDAEVNKIRRDMTAYGHDYD